MAYSKDFRCLVLDFVANGGSKAEAARRFGISRQSVFDWLKHPPDHKPGKPGPKGSLKYDQEELRAEVQANPDALLRELAASRKVSNNSIFLALKRLGFVRKKLYATAKVFVSLRGRDISSSGVMALNKPITFPSDETGFAPTTYRPYARAQAGQKIIGYRAAVQRPRTRQCSQ